MSAFLICSRALALGAALPLAALGTLVTAPAAHAADPPVCPVEAPVVTDVEFLGTYRLYVQSYEASTTTTLLCFDVSNTDVSGVFVVDTAADADPPQVVPTEEPESCGQEIVEFNAPVELQLSVHVDLDTTSLCVGKDDERTVLTVVDPSVNEVPAVHLWLSGSQVF